MKSYKLYVKSIWAPSIIVLRAQPWCLTLSCSRFTHLLQKFCPKIRFEASQAVFWSLSCCKELKPTIKLFTGCRLCDLLIQMQNIGLQSLGMCRKQNFVIVLGFKSDTAVLSITFHVLSFSLFSLFLPHFFSFPWHLVGIIFGKAFRILGLDERKGRWVVEQDFPRNFQVSVTLFFLPFCLVSLTKSCSFCCGLKDLFILHKLAEKGCHWPLKLMMSQAVEGTWIRTGGYGGKWVKRILKNPLFFYNTCRSSW